MPLVIPYIRFSTKEQEEGSSFERQRQKVDAWKKANPGYDEPMENYHDLGKSGTGAHIEKGRLGALLQAVEKGMVPPGSVILIEAVDRLTRLEPMEALEPVRTIINAGITLIDLEANTRYDRESLKGDALLMFLFKARGAYEYSARLAGRIVDSYETRAKDAKAGLSINRRNGFWLTGDGKLIPEAAAVVQAAFRMFINGTPIKAIVREFPTYFKKPASCRNVLRNPSTMGDWQRTTIQVIDGKKVRVPSERIPGVFDAAIDAATFHQAQSILDSMANPGYTTARKYRLAGLVTCAECRTKMHILRAGPNSVTDRVRCSTRVANVTLCSNSFTVPAPVLDYFHSIAHLPYIHKGFRASRLPELERRRIALQGKLGTAEKALQGRLRLIDTYPDDEELYARFKEAKDEVDNLKLELSKLPDSVDAHIPALGTPESDKYFIDFQNFMNNHTALSLNNILQLGGYEILVSSDGKLSVAGIGAESPIEMQYRGYDRKTKTFILTYGATTFWISSDGVLAKREVGSMTYD